MTLIHYCINTLNYEQLLDSEGMIAVDSLVNTCSISSECI